MWVHFSTSCLLSRVSLSVENVVQPGVSLQKSLIVVLAVVLLNLFFFFKKKFNENEM